MKARKQTRLAVVQTNGELVSVNPRRRSAARSAVNRKKGFGVDALPPLFGGRDNGRPSGIGYAFPLPPLLNSPGTLANVISHVGDGIPAIENLFEGFDGHVSHLITRDKLSRQVRTTLPVTKTVRGRTIRPMSRAVTPTSFKREFCQRLKAARVMANLDQVVFAKMMGILPNTYGKYERRSLLPHYLIPLACDILGISPNQLFPGIREAKKRAG